MRKSLNLSKPIRSPLSVALHRALSRSTRMAGGILAIGLAGGGMAAQAQVQLSALNGSNGFVINGVAGTDNSGTSVSGLGDVNGDGFDDLIIGAPNADRDTNTNNGESYVVFGSSGVFNSTLELSALDGDNGFILTSVANGDRAGISVSGLGDVNGDGVDDLLIGAYFADAGGSNRGESYVVFGNTAGFSSPFDLSSLDGDNGFVLNGVVNNDNSGFSVSGLGDFNDDGIDDLLIGADGANPNGIGSGAAYVVFGSSQGFNATLNLSSLNGVNGLVINGVATGDNAGRSVSGLGDVNGDGIDDLIIGARGVDTNGSYSGASYVVFGSDQAFSSPLELSALDGNNGFVINGIDAEDRSGRAVSGLGDFNGDGIDDLIIGAYQADPNDNANNLDNTGESYVVFGRSDDFSATLELSALDGGDGFIINGIDPDDRAGRAVSGLGDVDGDGIADLIIGAYRGNPNLQTDAGESYVVFGSTGAFTSPFALSALNGTNGVIINGINSSDESGRAVSGLGDINGDGVDDVLIGAPLADPNGMSSGESYVVFSPDTSPTQFTFTALTGVARSTLQTSNAIIVTGTAAAAPISVTGGSYSINNGAFVTTPGIVNPGASVRVRHTSSANFVTPTNTVLTIGGVSDTFTSTTLAADNTPAQFTFTDVTDVSLSTVQTSNPITVTGITAPAAISVTGGTYSLNGAPFTAAAGNAQNGNTIRVRHTSAATTNTPTDTILTIGGVSDTFTSTTRGNLSNAIFSDQFED